MEPTIKLDDSNTVRVIAKKERKMCVQTLIDKTQERGWFETIESCQKLCFRKKIKKL